MAAEDRRPLTLEEEDGDDDGREEELEDFRDGRVASRKRKSSREQSYTVSPHISETPRWKTNCRYGLCYVLSILVVAVICLGVGLFVGQSLGRRAVKQQGGGGGPTPVPPLDSYSWGDTVTVDGLRHYVFDWFSNNVQPEDIKNYLS